MKNIFQFGEHVKGYDILVLNEREARAGAGILFLFAMISFLNAYITHDFTLTQIFVTVFMIDFFVRIFINPKFAPSLIFGRLFVQHQKPEYVGALQKRFAWSIGFSLSVIMFVIIVLLEWMTPVKIVICVLCLGFLFSESAFGICIGCKIYHWIYKKSPHYCPGEVCQIHTKEAIQKISVTQITILISALIITSTITYIRISEHAKSTNQNTIKMKCESGKCDIGK